MILRGLKHAYKTAIRPLEAAYKFEAFHSPHLTDTDFDALPQVLLLGQYSTGKTTFINYLIERDFPNMRIGPEPTTDCFTAVMYGSEDRVIPGNALAAMSTQPFTGTQQFGMAFLNKFEAVTCNSPLLQKLTLIDTPGVLSGEKQRLNRSYNFTQVIEWFAGRADRIILLFDAHKLDISDEFKSAIEALAGHDDKIRCILNKSDSVTSQQLMRVYGSLMWSLGRVVRTPEVLRVYIGSFWHEEPRVKDNVALIRAEEADLLADLRSLPRNNAVRKVNELLKRARMAKVHALIVSHLRDQFGWFGKDSKQKSIIDNLEDHFKQVRQKHNLPAGDFPNVHRFRDFIAQYPIDKFPKLDVGMLETVEGALTQLIPSLMKHVPSLEHNLPLPMAVAPGSPMQPIGGYSNAQQASYNPSAPARPAAGGGGGGGASSPAPAAAAAASGGSTVYATASPAPPARPQQGASAGAGAGAGAGAASLKPAAFNPFDDDPDRASVGAAWAIDQKAQSEYATRFHDLKLVSGRLPAGLAKDVLARSGLPREDLRAVWALSDVDGDGELDLDEFTVAQYLMDRKRKQQGYALPTALPEELVPPSKREVWRQRAAQG